MSSCYLFSSEEQTDDGMVVQDTRVIDTSSSVNGCYTAVLQRDTANLVLQHEQGAESVSGDLVYNNFEKDDNRGTINGKIEGNLIVAYYRYFSEGTESVRQVVFKIKGDTLLEGYGDLNQLQDTTFFKKIEQLNILTDKPFVKRECE